MFFCLYSVGFRASDDLLTSMDFHQIGESIVFDTTGEIIAVCSIDVNDVNKIWQSCLKIRHHDDSPIMIDAGHDVTTEIFGDYASYAAMDSDARSKKISSVCGEEFEFLIEATKKSSDTCCFECIDAFCLNFMADIDLTLVK